MSTTACVASGVFVGFSREVPSIDPPSRWMRETSSIARGVSPVASRRTSRLKPSRMPMTSNPWFIAWIVAAEMTALMPGAGPPPTRIPRRRAESISWILAGPCGGVKRCAPEVACPLSSSLSRSGARSAERAGSRLVPACITPKPTRIDLDARPCSQSRRVGVSHRHRSRRQFHEPRSADNRGRTVNASDTGNEPKALPRYRALWLVLLVAVLTCFPGAGIAGSADGPLADYTITAWNENDCLPACRIRSMARDPDGYLWLATDAGLVRFDGVRFDTWSALGETRLPVGAVTALLSARDRSLWLGVSGRMPLGRIKDGKLTLHGERDGFNGSYTLSLLEDHEGAIWAGTIQGLFRRAGGGWERVGPEDGLGEGSVPAIYEDRQRRVWVATLNGVFRKEPGQDRFEQLDVITLSSNVWQGFSEDAAGKVWISDFNEGFR